MTKNWQTIIFVDLDNTVFKGPFHTVVFPTVLNNLSGKSGVSKKEIWEIIVEENKRRQKDPTCPATTAMDWDDIISVVSHRLDVKLDINITRLVKENAGEPYSKLLDDAANVLKKLKTNNRAVIAVTIGLRKYQLPVLKALNIEQLFDDIMTPDRSHASKQELKFYGEWPSLTHLNIVVGDHYEDDVVSPTKFGFKTIWVNRSDKYSSTNLNPIERAKQFKIENKSGIRPDAIICSLKELLGLVEHYERMTS
jgi:FMN phosphatase YigB (HAD superfamily)